jgi:hypothetical protein
MKSKRRQPRHCRHIKRLALMLAAVTLTSAAAMLPAAIASAPTQPPRALFRSGYNLCHAAPLAAIRKAGRQHYKAGTFSHGACAWERSDLKAGIALSTHPTSVGKALMKMFRAQSGKQHVTARAIKIPQATRALLVTLPAGQPTERSKYLFAAYQRGVIQVNMTAPKSLPTTRLRAVLGLVSR